MILGSMFQLLAIALGAAVLVALCMQMISRFSLRRRRAERLEAAFERAQSIRLKDEIGRGTAANF